ncbi:alpha/beta fold hydrolase [Actinomycetes bacterium M1A6_2h]
MTRGTADANGLTIAYEDMGEKSDPPVLLIMGLGCQLITWSLEFCERLVDAGYRVIRFDNRDIGLSSKIDGARVSGNPLLRLVRHELGMSSSVPYTIEDMAMDTVGLIDHLGIDKVHVVGASMGGMITQVFAGAYPKRVLSVSILFSSTNEKFLPPPDVKALLPLFRPAPKNASREQIIERSAATFATIGGKKYASPQAERIASATEAYERNYNPAGFVRQFAAITGTGSLARWTRRITAPTVIVHGTSDPLVRPAGGKAIHRAVPGSELILIDGMGHDLPNALLDRITDAFVKNFAKGARAV